jgi:3-deoxy-D-manno-octulosonate 8-phosphate phosphatase (KDO 8-P phosphatase)
LEALVEQVNDRVKSLSRGIRALVLDVDGVLTDAQLQYGARGESMKSFSARDGFAVKLAQSEGIAVALLSGRVGAPVRARVADLGIPAPLVMLGSRDKGRDLLLLAERLNLPLEQIAFMGDDMPDLPALARAGLAVCPADASEEAKRLCHVVCEARGGHGAVRELIKLLLESRDRWQAIVAAWERGTAAAAFYAATP